MNYRESFDRFVRDPRTIFDWVYWIVRGIRVMAMRDAYLNDKGTLAALATLVARQTTVGLSHVPLAEVVGDISEHSDTKELGRLYTSYGSDKATKHDYYLLYSFLLRNRRHTPLKVLEIGLGTNNIDVPSNMGRNGKPGASLRAFRDWAPKAMVYGADVDKRVLFSDERIETFFVDQTDPDTLSLFAAKFPAHSLDLIIDDGLHNTWANLNMLNTALDLIKPDGYFVVEDIVEKYIPTWKLTVALLSAQYHCQIIKCKAEYVFIVSKKK